MRTESPTSRIGVGGRRLVGRGVTGGGGFLGAEFKDLTGSPVLIQVGELDDYHAADTCPDLVQSLPEEVQDRVSLKVYRRATHGWDRLQPPMSVFDPFACFGTGCDVHIVPRVGTALRSRARAVAFLKAAFGDE